MSSGKAASLVLSGVAAFLALGAGMLVWGSPWMSEMNDALRLIVSGLVASAAVLAVLFPLGHSFDRNLQRLRHGIDEAVESRQPLGAMGPRWLRSTTASMSESLDRVVSRMGEVESDQQQLQVKQRVLEAEHRQLKKVLNVLWDGVLVTDRFDEIAMANIAAGRILGFDPDGVLHQSVGSVLEDENLTRLITEIRAQGRTSVSRRYEMERPTTTEHGEPATALYEVLLSCVVNHKDEVAGVVVLLHDVTKERDLSQMKSDFVSKASHELRTPLSSIRAYVEMLVDGEADDEESRAEFCSIIQHETERLGRLIDNMLNISRIEAGIIQIDRESVDIKQLISRAVETIEPQAREKDIAVNTRLVDMDLTVEGDRDMLYQVAINLMSNAVKYTPEGGRITVTADSDNLTRSVVVSVSDTGLGIPPDDVPKIFDKFFRVENYKRVAKGTGLGLSLCKHIVESVHQGQIGVESTLGMGSRFWYSLPMRYEGTRFAA